MKTATDHHPSEDDLEHYSLDLLPEDRFFAVSDHLSECAECSARLDQLTPFCKASRTGAARVVENPPSPWHETLNAWFAAPGKVRLIVPAGALAVTLAVAVTRPWEAAGPPVAVALQTNRGAAALSGHAPAGRQIKLMLDTAGLDGTKPGRVELVDVTGNPVLNATPGDEPSAVSVLIKQRLAPGRYWVRLYGSQAPDLLREYGLEILP